MKMQFSDNIRKLRTERGLTQTQLAAILGVNKSIISAYENQDRLPSLNVLVKLSAEFGVPMEQLLGTITKKTIDVSELTKEQTMLVSKIVAQFSELNSKS
ncbi:MAG: helix-turn-helix transcriptional regulator [Clostridia bacterium]|nr:helix-turn-helix transcriptional regulator [Clostridia bacterium]